MIDLLSTHSMPPDPARWSIDYAGDDRLIGGLFACFCCLLAPPRLLLVPLSPPHTAHRESEEGLLLSRRVVLFPFLSRAA
jgi:hypothetical protein